MCTSPFSPFHRPLSFSAPSFNRNVCFTFRRKHSNELHYKTKPRITQKLFYTRFTSSPIPYFLSSLLFFFAKKHFEKCEIVNEFSFRSLSEPSPLVAKFLCFSFYFECAGRMKKSDWGREKERESEQKQR